MKTIFEGASGKRALIDALKSQMVFNGNTTLIEEAAAGIELFDAKKGQVLIEEGGCDADLFLILKGPGVQICIEGRPIGAREAGECVGEMAALEPHQTRSATAIATGVTAVAKIPFATFESLSKKFPEDVLRGVARTIAKRLRERKKYIRPRSTVPKLFIGSSMEGLSIAQEIQLALKHEKFVTSVWTDSVFKPSSTAIEDLAKAFDDFDFALFVLSPDDEIKTRDTESRVARDNVVLELGMFIGAMTRDRVFALAPRRKDFRRPSDLFGVNFIEYDESKLEVDFSGALAHVATEVRRVVTALEAR